jgi:dTDP-4-dehydrorhamnose 3,5-epimerase-like enzyme
MPEGQINLSLLDQGVVKAFHRHQFQDDYVVCLKGKVRLCTFRNSMSDFDSKILSPLKPEVIHIPANTWHGYQALDKDTEILYYCTNKFNGQDEERLPWDINGVEIWDIDFK